MPRAGGRIHFIEHAEFFERAQRRFLFGHLLVRPPRAGEAPAGDLDADLEALAVIRAFLVEQFIDGRGGEQALGVLLEHRLVVMLMIVAAQRVDLRADGAQDVFADRLKPPVQVNRRHDRLIHRRRQRVGKLLAVADALADDQQVMQPGFLRDFRAGSSGDDRGLDLGEIAFEIAGEPLVKRFADDEIEHGIAEELHAFIAVNAIVGDGGMRERLVQQIGIDKAIAEQFLGPLAQV